MKLPKIASVITLLLVTCVVAAQQPNDSLETENDSIIPIQYRAELLESDIAFGKGVQRLSGEVVLFQKDVFIYCDTAYFNQSENSFRGFGSVHVTRGDTVDIYADSLRYLGNQKFGYFRDSVRLEDSSIVLTTDFLDFDLIENVGYYYNGGKIVDSTNTLASIEGYYYPDDSLYLFNDSVVLTNAEYVMYTDTLKYNFKIEKTFFYGPTRIVSEENLLYCENGWYDLKADVAQFNENAYYESNAQTLRGDSLYYNRRAGVGKAFDNVELADTVENVIIKGHYGAYYENSDYSLITKEPLFIHVSDGDSLFLHADTLLSHFDSTGTYRHLKAFHHAKLFRHDFQAQCDSMFYSFEDSVIQMHIEPVLWSEENQITAKYIELHTKNEAPDFFELRNTAFIVSEVDSTRYNQIKGATIFGYFRDSQLYKIEVRNNAESLYFLVDNYELAGVNVAKCKDMDIYMKEGTVDRILFLEKPEATLHPPLDLPPSETRLQHFKWLNTWRPKSKADVFIWKAETVPAPQ